MGAAKPDSDVNLTIIRNGSEKGLNVQLGELKDKLKPAEQDKQPESKIGLNVKEITPELAQKYKLDREEGVIIFNVERGSKAFNAGFRSGDIIVNIDKEEIKSIDDYEKAIEKVVNGKLALFLVKRGESSLYIGYRFEDDKENKEE